MAFQDASITFAEDLGTEVIDIFVGPERKRYVVHKQPLTSKSEYFRTVFNGNFKEAQENSIHLKEEDPAAVALMIGWVYRGVIPGTGKKISAFAQPFVPQPTKKSDVPNATSINGSQYPFAPYYEAEPHSSSGLRNAFHNIGFQPQYRMFSQEELRLADYEENRRYSDSNQPPNHRGLFGGPPMVGNNHPVPAPPPPANPPGPMPPQTGGVFGTVPPNPAAPPSAAAPSAIPSTRLWASSWGQSQTTTSLFGSPLPPSQTGGGSSLFGNAQTAPPALSTQSGGSSINSTPAQPVQTANTTPATTQAASTATTQGTSLFGNVNAPAHGQASATLHTGGLFGGLGSRNLFTPSPPQQTSGLFGLTTATPSSSTPFGGTPTFDQLFSAISTHRDTPRPGSFGYKPIIEYPKSFGTPIPGIPRGEPWGILSAEQQAQQSALLHLCLLAETILWPELYNAAVEAYVRGELNLHRPIPPKHVDLIYDRTPTESTLRAYVLESMCTNRGDSLMYVDLTRQYDELMEDILNKLPTLRIPEQQAPWLQEEFIRSFHMPMLSTGKGKEVAGKDVEVTGVAEQEDNASAST